MDVRSLQVCMDSADWPQGGGGVNSEETGREMTESSISSPSAATEDILVCARPILEPPRLRPPHDQALKCPRCDSTHTKFCYYNNYSLSQPRYFCKTCRRYWTKGGTLRNIPVGGGCRKVKKPAAAATPNNKIKRVVTSSDNSNSSNSNLNNINSSVIDLQPMFSGPTATDLHLSFPEVASFTGLFGSCLGNMGPVAAVLESRFCGQPFDFLESKVKADHQVQGGVVVNVRESSSGRSHDYMGNIAAGGLSVVGGAVGENLYVDPHLGFDDQHGPTNFYNGPMGSSSFDEGKHHLPDTCQRIMLPYEGYDDDQREHDRDSNAAIDVKPLTSSRLLSLDWQDQVYLNGIGSWNNMMCTFGPSTTSPLV